YVSYVPGTIHCVRSVYYNYTIDLTGYYLSYVFGDARGVCY
ncbi:unnamed protein product, partial [Rotaria sp. Silwood1]